MEYRRNTNRGYLAWVIACGLWVASIGSRGDDELVIQYDRPRLLGELANAEINESSGIAASRRLPGAFWTHNDSGDRPRIFAFDRSGKHLGECRIRGATAVDWEDMVSFGWGGKNWLLLADTGDNARRRLTYALYLCEEPAVTDTTTDARTFAFRYEDGAHDCEAVAVDVREGVILLATKVLLPYCRVYELALPAEPTRETLVARHMATVEVPFATAMDISPDGRLAVIATYGDGYLFVRGDRETWRTAFTRAPQRVSLPARRQGESICFGLEGHSLYLTSERRPTPLWEVPALAAPLVSP